MKDNYLLTTPMGERLFREVAEELPLIDFHNHLNVNDLAANRQFENVYEIWLAGDPYKHRAMRICGIDENYITGSASPQEKFRAWCATYPRLAGGPLYDWSAMEMEKVFGIHTPINADNAARLWDEVGERLAQPELRAAGLMKRFNTEYAAPCASLTDDLAPFASAALLAPSLRGDDLVKPDRALCEKLETLTGIKIDSFSAFLKALDERIELFHKAGCRFSDHALDNGFRYVCSDGGSEARFTAAMNGEEYDRAAMMSDMLRALAEMYAKRGWTMQLHIGAQRFTSTRIRKVAGAAGGFAAIGQCVNVSSLCSMLDDMEQSENGLPKVILYTLNPADNAVMSVLSGSFVGVTQGPAWWWCDHLQGMRQMLEEFASYSVLSTFVGMTTDSRSLLSLLRHDYFRRALCGWMGEKAERGELPDSFDSLSPIVKAMCYGNAAARIKATPHNTPAASTG